MATPTAPLELIAGLLNDAFGSGAQIAADGAIHLQFDGALNVAIAVSPDETDLVYYAVLGPADGGRGVIRMAAALALNLHQVATRGGAIGLDTNHQTLIFSWRMGLANSEPATWLAALDQFCATTRELHDALGEALADWSESALSTIESNAAREAGIDEASAFDPAATPTDPDEPFSPGEFLTRPGGPIRA